MRRSDAPFGGTIRGVIVIDQTSDRWRVRRDTCLHRCARKHDPVGAPRDGTIRHALAARDTHSRELAVQNEPREPPLHRRERDAFREPEGARHPLAELAMGHVRPALSAPRVGSLELLPEHPRQRGPVIKIGRRRRGLARPRLFARHVAPAGRRPAPTPQRLGPRARSPAGVCSQRDGEGALATAAHRPEPVRPRNIAAMRVVPLKKGTRSPSLDSSRLKDEGRAFWRKPAPRQG